LFEKAADYQAFEQVLRDTLDQSPMRICAYAVMPNHWHPTPIANMGGLCL
jgi:REP element-mobilizing transposase RayT